MSSIAPQTLPSLSDPDKYVVGERLAVGSTAEVYRGILRGRDGFRRPVVIKKLRPELAADPVQVRRFADDARLAARLVHANIVQVLDLGRAGGEHFLVLEYLDGPNLGDLVGRARQLGSARLPVPLAAFIAGELLKALDHAHRLADASGRRAGCVHRDVSPANVMLSRDGQVKLTDFAHHSASGRPPSRPGHAAPEVLRGEASDARADVFSVGVLLHELLTGRRLFDGRTRAAVVEAVQRGPVAPPSTRAAGVPGELDAVVLRALQRDPDARFPDADSFLQALLHATVPHFPAARCRDLANLLDQVLGPLAPAAVADTDPFAGLPEPAAVDDEAMTIALPRVASPRPADGATRRATPPAPVRSQTPPPAGEGWVLGPLATPVGAEPAWAGGGALPAAGPSRAGTPALVGTAVTLGLLAVGAAWYLQLF